MRRIYDDLLQAIDGTEDIRAASAMGVALHVMPAARVTMGGRIASSVRIDVVLPAVALASFRRRRRFIAAATAAVVALSEDPTIQPRVVVRIVHAVDGGWGFGGHAFTNDEIDEGPQ
ncbi:MAG: hypothetical protein IAI50_12440 [Candidatus Eremiobacteraeota bacterium]|nr:hypothetical protein [Candidatus Eremiobacteraeota bacterium]